MTRAVAYALALALALMAGWAVPALAMRSLGPSLQSSPLVRENYRSRRVYLGLGLVWAVWSVSLLAASTAMDALAEAVEAPFGSIEMVLFDGPLTLALYAVPIILVLASVVFGMADDVFGTSADKGFKGHLRALASGRLSTGGLKLLGIGVIAAVYGWSAASGRPGAGEGPEWTEFVAWVVATLVIALSANLLNLLDLRPGRALKSYAVLVVPAAVVFGLDAIDRYRAFTLETAVGWTAADTAVTLAALVIVLLGPVLAVWRADLGELGMLGDAGSNAMGAVVGYLLAGALPLAWLTGVAALLLGLNLLSERVSFSTIIERVPLLRFFDGLGRLPAEGDAEDRG